ncbi:MAG: (d)CMP kinase [Bacillota bacterium]
MPKTIAIDGPAGAGKSTIARLLAKKLGYIYIDTGAMYRAITLKALENGIDFDDEEALTDLAETSRIKLAFDDDGCQLIYLNGRDVSEDIRTPRVSQHVSLAAKVPGVRHAMVRLQRELAAEGGVVMDGRDIGSYVLPNADVKMFLTASIEERARRRKLDLEAKGYEVDIKQLVGEITARDKIDSSREMAPLIQAPDAVLVDSSNMTIDEVVALMIDIINEK